MKSMTRVDALNYAISAISVYNEVDQQVIDTLKKIRDTIAKDNARKPSDAAKVKQSEAHKAKTAELRRKAMENVLPVLRETFAAFPVGVTSTELFNAAKDKLPMGYKVDQIRYILSHDMANELIKEENGRNPFLYRLKESA